MIGRKGFWILFIMVFTTLITSVVFSQTTDSSSTESGKVIYNKYCVICHGEKGDGKGLVGIVHRAQRKGVVANIYPRDFTAGIFKFRSTPTGSLPTDEDLLRTITKGVPRSGMPGHGDVTLEERKAVIAYIKTFSKRWNEEKSSAESIKINMPSWVGSEESIKKGEQLWNDVQCSDCHGNEGRGDGPSAFKLKDNWGDQILPFDFTSGPLKGGDKIEDVYRTFVTGLDGTPMPSYADSLDEEQRWHLVSYALKLMGKASDLAKK
jgi:cytochrome c oxidase cbb3-type subunit 2